MIEFKQKQFAEYDAMRSLYVELMKDYNWRQKIGIIDQSALIPILRGNNIVIERFVITTSFLHRDKYRMYIKIGARAKLPDDVRLPGWTTEERLGRASINFNTGFNSPKQNEFSEYNGIISQKDFSKYPEQKMFWDGPKQQGGGGQQQKKKDKDKGPGQFAKASFQPEQINISHEVQVLLGEAIKYDKKGRTLVLEFDDIDKAIRALNILPFGINYKIYLLDV